MGKAEETKASDVADDGGADDGGDEDVGEDSSEAFDARILQLYDLYEDWTGDSGDEGELFETQGDGSPVIDAGAALGTIVMFGLRLASDLGVTREQFDAVLSEIRAGIEQEEQDEEDTQPRAKGVG